MKHLVVIVAFAFSSQCCLCQEESDSSRVKLKFDQLLGALRLDTLQGKIPVLYSSGYTARARAISNLMANCVRFYEQQFPGTTFGTQIVLIDSAAWQRISRDSHDPMPPYGMPNNNSEINTVFIGADKKAVAHLFGQTDNLPDSVLSIFDNVALHELGHIFLIRLNHTYFEQRWVNEFLATYFAICFLEEIHSKTSLPRVDLSPYQPHFKTLEDFQRLYGQMDGPNFAWYHGKFTKLAYDLYPSYKINLLSKFIASQANGEGKGDPLTLLRKLSPEITNQWVTEMK